MWVCLHPSWKKLLFLTEKTIKIKPQLINLWNVSLHFYFDILNGKLYLDLEQTNKQKKNDKRTQRKVQAGKYLLSQLLSVQKQWHIILEHLKVNSVALEPYHHRVFLKQCLWKGSCGKSIYRSHPDVLLIVWTPSAVVFTPLKDHEKIMI